jgi:hypothetical protein
LRATARTSRSFLVDADDPPLDADERGVLVPVADVTRNGVDASGEEHPDVPVGDGRTVCSRVDDPGSANLAALDELRIHPAENVSDLR